MHWIAWVDTQSARSFGRWARSGYPEPKCTARLIFPKISPKKPKGIRAYPRAEAASLSAQTKGKKMVSSRLKPAASWLGPTHLYAGPSAYARGFMGLWLKKRPYPRPGVCRFTAGRPVPCTKSPISSTSYPTSSTRFVRVLSAMRSQHNLLAASKDQSPDLTLYQLRIDSSANA